jgi:catechol 2,3-dioxygenase-like lactoylglutathione lyase family enzyme
LRLFCAFEKPRRHPKSDRGFCVSARRRKVMLSSAILQTLVCTTRLDAARHFYGDVLGLHLKGCSHGALVYAVGDGELRVSPVKELEVSVHTVCGFAVSDLRAEMRDLAARGVRFEPIGGLPQDADAVLTTGEGARVAWFKDPDGNILSLVQYA